MEILTRLHVWPTAGRFGVVKTYTLIARDFWWPRMTNTVRQYVTSCEICARNKLPRQKPSGLLHPLPIPDRPWSSVSMDFISKLPQCKNHDTILVVVDRFTKMAHFIPCNEKCYSAERAKLILSNVIKFHGIPDDIISDRGPQFVSKFWKSLLTKLKVKRKLSTARHSETDGHTERVNQILEQYLRCYINILRNDWVDFLPLAEFS
jgi:transposase InsO family protein